MRINDDLDKPVTVDAAGIDRRRRYRMGAEMALQHADIFPMPA